MSRSAEDRLARALDRVQSGGPAAVAAIALGVVALRRRQAAGAPL